MTLSRERCRGTLQSHNNSEEGSECSYRDPHLTLASRLSTSLKVIGTDTERSSIYCFLLTCHSNHGPIWYRFRDKLRLAVGDLCISNFVHKLNMSCTCLWITNLPLKWAWSKSHDLFCNIGTLSISLKRMKPGTSYSVHNYRPC